MSESKLFMSSCSRRQLARRRAARSALALQQLVVVALVAGICAAAFVVGRGGL